MEMNLISGSKQQNRIQHVDDKLTRLPDLCSLRLLMFTERERERKKEREGEREKGEVREQESGRQGD